MPGYKEIISQYFKYSKSQRNAICVALALIVLCLITKISSRYWWLPAPVPADSAFIIQAEALQADKPELVDGASYDRLAYKRKYSGNYREHTANEAPAPAQYFDFDPNTLSTAGWKKLGLRDKTIQTIQNYLGQGGRFRQPADIAHVYGLYPDQVKRLLPYIKIVAASQPSNPYGTVYAPKAERSPVFQKSVVPKLQIDVNAADTTAFISLRGIGPKLAFRIINFRDKLGGFYSVNQVGETFGLADSVFQKILAQLTCNTPTLKRLDVNTADVNVLKAHPYIRWNIAAAIVAYRVQHGPFKDISELQNIALIDDATLKKLQPYLQIG